MLKQKYFLADIFILSAEKQPIKLSWRKIVCLPDIWVNHNPVAFHYIPTIKTQNNSKQYSCNNIKSVSDKSIIRIMDSSWRKNHPEYWQEGNRANSIFKLACLMCKWGIDKDLVIEYFVDGWKSQTMNEDEIMNHVINAYKAEADNFGTLQFRMY